MHTDNIGELEVIGVPCFDPLIPKRFWSMKVKQLESRGSMTSLL